ncbi:major facilitator transporter [Rhodococcus rhodnii LMG 5362]|uniref:Major facilitator transporter n=2 Tax=Rhodococcus rhodnii TaxID=38312 RepID=R7WLS3_9NOCA|nr:major facilitator transporter [Rhodococcus rhodnii LMG 5362]
MLALGMFAQSAQSVFVNGVAFLIPELRDTHGGSLGNIGLLVAAPTVGVLVALVAWGAAADRWGERVVLAAGLTLTALGGLGAALASSVSLGLVGVLLFVGGVGAASSNTASGRVVVGWFPADRRGLAMGIRQMSLPLGIAFAALTLPPAGAAHGIGWALAIPAAACGIAALACAVGIVDPPRPAREDAAGAGLLDNPYRQTRTLVRIHAASALLVVPQQMVWTFSLVWLLDRRGWDAAAAGLLITVTQIGGALGRMAVGQLSDRMGSRLRPMRGVAVVGCLSVAGLALTDLAGSSWSVVFLVVASLATVAPNGLAFTAVAETAGPFLSGRALGLQNTGQFAAAALVPPVLGTLIGTVGYPATFALAAVFPALATPLVPDDRGSLDRGTTTGTAS